jgi:TIR domain
MAERHVGLSRRPIARKRWLAQNNRMSEKRVFICYRDQDNPFAAGRIADFLKSRLGPSNVFRYVEKVGVTFDEITKRLLDSDVVLVVVGKNWKTASADGRLWFNDPNDFLRIEIEYAFGRGLPVIPVLIEDSSLGYPAEYPDPLKPLTRINPARVSGRDFEKEAEALLGVVNESKPMPPPLPGSNEKISAEDLVLIWRSWRAPKQDHRHPSGGPVYRFDVVIGAAPEILDRIDRVVYYLPPAWPDSPASISDRPDAFRLKEIAWWDLTIRARVYVRDQADVVALSTHVWLWQPERI